MKHWMMLALLFVLAVGVGLRHAMRHRTQQQSIHFQAVLPNSGLVDPPGLAETRSEPTNLFMTLDPTKKFLVDSRSGKPVFITGEDAWSLQVQLSDTDIELYLSDRAAKGFNAIWVGLADNYYSNHPPKDFYGNVPFNGPDFTNENPKYWARVDQTIVAAAKLGITVMATPAFVGYGCKEGYCESYRTSSTEVLNAYGQFLGDRYKASPNVVWVIGGDADPLDKNVQSKLYALATGIRSKDSTHLMATENYRGSSSADVWSGAPWLDLNALYFTPEDIPARCNAAYLVGRYPPFLFEDWYEGEHGLTELDVRREGYWAVLSGCTLGRLFGNDAIWNFTWSGAKSGPWKEQLNSPGSVGHEWLGKLFRSREHWKLVPDIDHKVMTAGFDPRSGFATAKDVIHRWSYGNSAPAPTSLSVAARTSDGHTIIAYVPNGSGASISIDLSKIADSGSQARCWWFNPRDGSAKLIGILETAATHKFTPPDVNDWVLVIDSAAADLSAPATKDL